VTGDRNGGVWLAASVLLARHLTAQPALPPTEQARLAGTVVRASRAEGLALDSGLSAPVADGLQLAGAAELESVWPGDLVELVRDENGLVTHLWVLPRLAQRVPLWQAATPQSPVSRFWWEHGGEAYPDSLHAAEATFGLQRPATALEATVAFECPTAGETAEFTVLDNEKAVIWAKRLAAGTSAALRCPLLKGGSLTLRCRLNGDRAPDDQQCVWGNPAIVLRELGLIPLHPSAADDLVGQLAAGLAGVDAGAIGLALPRVHGLSPSVARDLQQDLLVAVGRAHRVVGVLPWEADRDLSDAQRQQAQAASIASVLVSEVRYSPDGTMVKAALVHAASGETLAVAETTVKP
jgi:hypothetical protein